jgi:CelD/BcsL family acetyltransferase involved in cellulose biosynthesis
MRLGFQMGKTLYLYYSGWDAAYGRYSVMTTLLAETIKDAIARGLTSVNLSTGNDVSKTRWRPQEIRYHSRIEVAPGLAAVARYSAFRAARSVAARRVTREMLPSALVRRSEPRSDWPLLPRLSFPEIIRLRGVAAAAAASVALDLLDNRLDHQLLLAPQLLQSLLS